MKIDPRVVDHLFSEVHGYPLTDKSYRPWVMQFAEAIEKEALQLQSDEQQDFGTGPAILGKGGTTSVTRPNEIPWQIQVRLRCAEAVAQTLKHNPSTGYSPIAQEADRLLDWVLNRDMDETGIPVTESQAVDDLMSGTSIHDTTGDQ